MIKKVSSLSICMIVLLAIAQPVLGAEQDNATQAPLAMDVPSAILLEQSTGTILFDKHAHDQLPPASMTKLMTLLLVMEAIDDGILSVDEMVRVSERASSMGGSQVFLAEGEEMSVDDLLKSVAIASGNDASVALAERLEGSEEQFVVKMNDKVRELGLENTQFKNASGLPAEGQFSTAYDMAMISKELLRHEEITTYTSIYDDYLRKGEKNEFWLVNTNKLIHSYPGADGLKTGFTQEAKYCLAATAKRDDMRVIAVVMGAESVKTRNQTIAQMFDYAYNQFSTTQIVQQDERMTTISMIHADEEEIDLVASEPIYTLHEKRDKQQAYTWAVSVDQDLELPIKQGTEIGTISILSDGEIIRESPLTVAKDIEKASYFTLLKRSMQHIAKK